MKAVICTSYKKSNALKIVQLPKPVPKADEVLIKIHATTVTTGDWRIRSHRLPLGFGLLARFLFGFSAPRHPVLGTELAGEIEAIGPQVTKFKVGDRVIAASGASYGCHAEYKCIPQEGPIVLKPDLLSDEEAAALPFGGVTALTFLRDKGQIKAGDNVLINGASGSVGLAAVQLARYFGATVTGVCSESNFELVRSMGASKLIDYRRQDFTENGETYDIVLDTVGTLSFAHCKGSLKETGRLLLVSGDLPSMLQIPWITLSSTKKVIGGVVTQTAEALGFIVDLIEKKKYKSVIDRVYPFEQIPEAYDYIGRRHKSGNVAITV